MADGEETWDRGRSTEVGEGFRGDVHRGLEGRGHKVLSEVAKDLEGLCTRNPLINDSCV